MKKIILSIAFVTAGFFAFNASAQQPCCNTDQACCQPSQECCNQKAKPQRAPKANPMEGITLTAEQQAAVKALNEKNKGPRTKDSRKEYLKEMKAILTPEQYTTYLENMALNAPRPQVKAKKGQRDGRQARKHDGQKNRKQRDSQRGERKAKPEAKPDANN